MPRRIASLALLLAGCADPREKPDDPLMVGLRWIPGAGDGDWEAARAGVWWALSNLGADPPDEAGLTVLDEADTVDFTLDLGAVGFPEARLPDVEAAVAPVRGWSDEPVDVGRFLLATLYEPGRYYAITGACATLGDWRAARQAEAPAEYAVTLSLLVAGDRLVTLNPAPAEGAVREAVAALGWVAAEGEGSLAEGSFAAAEYETVDVMPNGQQRFAVYDAAGALRAAAAETGAGQPGKCMWCHEMNVQRGTPENPSAPGYLDYTAFAAEVDAAEAWIHAARASATVVDFEDYAVHERAEQLTRAFLEPSADRVAREWGVSLEEVRAEGLPTHTSEEFPALSELYDRADVDAAYARRTPGWAPLDVPDSDREGDPDRALVGTEALGCTAGAGPR